MPFYNNIWFIGKYLKSDEYLNKLSVSEYKNVAEEYNRYRENLGLGKNFTYSADALDKYIASANARLNNFDLFKDNQAMHERLKSTSLNETERQAAEAIKNDFNALSTSNNLTAAQSNFNQLTEAFKTKLDDLSKPGPGPKNYQALIGAMKGIGEEAIEAVKAQHELEKSNLQAKFNNDAFKQNIKTALNLRTDADVTAAQQSMLQSLTTTQGTELAALEKSIGDSMNTLHKAVGKQQSDFLFIANLHKNNSYMRQTLIQMGDKIRDTEFQSAKAARDEENRQRLSQEPPLPALPDLEPPATSVTFNMGPRDMSLVGVSVKDLDVIKSMTGKEIKHDKSSNSFEIEMGATLWDWKYYQDPRQTVEADMLLMAQAIRACGHDKIVLNLDYDNPEEALLRGRQAYNAAIEAGFAPEDIVVKIKGEEFTVGKDKDGKQVDMVASRLFKDQGQELGLIRKRSMQIQNELNQLLKPVEATEDAIRQYRREMEELRPAAGAGAGAGADAAPPVAGPAPAGLPHDDGVPVAGKLEDEPVDEFERRFREAGDVAVARKAAANQAADVPEPAEQNAEPSSTPGQGNS